MSSGDRWKKLIVKAQQGDEASYTILLNELYPVIRRYLIARLGALGQEEDLTQECLVALHKSRHTYDSSRPFEPWMFTVVRYKAIDILRKKQKQWQREVIDNDFLATKAAPISNNEGEDLDRIVKEALEELPTEMRKAVELTKIEGLDTETAAKQEGISAVALRSRVSRAYKLMRKKMEKDFVHR